MASQRYTFGKPFRSHFQFDPSYIPLNHGAYGAFPIQIRDELRRLQSDIEARPDWYTKYEYPRLLVEAREATAKLVNADLDDVVLVPNATTASNTVLRSLVWNEGDYVLHYDVIYGALRNALQYIEETTPLKSKCIDVKFPAPDDTLIQRLEDTILQLRADSKNPRMVILDTIASMPGIRVPFEKLVRKCKELGVMTLIDGAHGIGHIPLDLKALDADFFTSNLHKWLYTPRSCALFHVPKRNHHLIRTSVPTSWSFKPVVDGRLPEPAAGSSWLVQLLSYVGTLDTQCYLTVPAALKFRQDVCGGEDAIREYSFRLAREAGNRAAEILGTEVMDCPGSCIRDCAFSNVRLPLEIGSEPGQVKPEHKGLVQDFFQYRSTADHDTYLQVIPYHGALYWRLSGQTYVNMDDFIFGANVAERLCRLVRKGEHLTSQSAPKAY